MRISVRLPIVSFLGILLGLILGSGTSSARAQAIHNAGGPPDAFMYIAGVYDNFGGIDFDSHVLSGAAAFSWLAKIDTVNGNAAWATKVHSGSNAVVQSGAGGPWVVANRRTGDIYAAVCPLSAGPGTVVSFYEAGSMTAVTTRTMTNGSHVYLVKYDRVGVLQWVRNTLYTVTSGPPDANKFMNANMPNLCMLPGGNVVLAASVQTGNSGNPDATIVKWSDGASTVDAALLGEDGNIQGVLLEIDPAGTFVSSKLSEGTGGFAGGGSPNTPVILSPIANAKGFVAGHLRAYRETILLGKGEANEFTTGPIATYGGMNGHYAKYNTAKLLQWAAATVPVNSGAASIGPFGEPTSAWIDSKGNVYSADLLWGQTSQPGLRAHLQGGGFSDTGSIDVAMPAANAGSGQGAPVYEKRNAAGLPVWARGFGPSSVFGDDFPRPITITVIDTTPWIAGVVRNNPGERLYLDEGLPSEVQLQGDLPPYPRAMK